MSAPEQPLVEFELFRERVLADPVLLQELRGTRDMPEFINASIEAAQKMGIVLKPAEIEAELRAARREWIERWVQ